MKQRIARRRLAKQGEWHSIISTTENSFVETWPNGQKVVIHDMRVHEWRRVWLPVRRK